MTSWRPKVLHSITTHIAGWLLAGGGMIYAAAPRKVTIERRYCFYGILAVIAIFTYVAALSALYAPPNNIEFWKFAGLFLGPTLVAIGWIVTNEVNIRNSRKQHTVTLINQYFTNAQRVADKDVINKALPFPKVLDGKGSDFDDTSESLLRSVARELNYFDFLASGVLNREIDEDLLRRVFCIVIRHYCLQFRPYIDHWREKDASYWKDLLALNERWHDASAVSVASGSPGVGNLEIQGRQTAD
jgi:hypothetical protein